MPLSSLVLPVVSPTLCWARLDWTRNLASIQARNRRNPNKAPTAALRRLKSQRSHLTNPNVLNPRNRNHRTEILHLMDERMIVRALLMEETLHHLTVERPRTLRLPVTVSKAALRMVELKKPKPRLHPMDRVDMAERLRKKPRPHLTDQDDMAERPRRKPRLHLTDQVDMVEILKRIPRHHRMVEVTLRPMEATPHPTVALKIPMRPHRTAQADMDATPRPKRLLPMEETPHRHTAENLTTKPPATVALRTLTRLQVTHHQADTVEAMITKPRNLQTPTVALVETTMMRKKLLMGAVERRKTPMASPMRLRAMVETVVTRFRIMPVEVFCMHE